MQRTLQSQWQKQIHAADGKGAQAEAVCAICIEALLGEGETSSTVQALPSCGHLFHPECIRKWFQRTNVPPPPPTHT